MFSLFSVRPDRRILRETPGDTAGGAAPPGGAAKPTFEEWIAEPINSEYTARIRQEAATNRVKAKTAEAEVTKRFAEAVGVEYDPTTPPSIEDLVGKMGKLPEELKAARGRERGLQLDLHLEKAFAVHGAKPMLARAYLSESGAMQKLKALDPASETYADDVGFHVAEAIESEPGLKGQSTMPRRTSAPMTPNPTSQQLSRADLESMSADEIDRARRAGLLDEVLGRR